MVDGAPRSSGAVQTAVKALPLSPLLLLKELMDVLRGHHLSEEKPLVMTGMRH